MPQVSKTRTTAPASTQRRGPLPAATTSTPSATTKPTGWQATGTKPRTTAETSPTAAAQPNVKAQVAALQLDPESQKSILEAKAQLAGFESQLAALQAQLSTAQTQAQTAQQALDQTPPPTGAKLVAAQKKLDAANGKVSTLNTDIATLQGQQATVKKTATARLIDAMKQTPTALARDKQISGLRTASQATSRLEGSAAATQQRLSSAASLLQQDATINVANQAMGLENDELAVAAKNLRQLGIDNALSTAEKSVTSLRTATSSWRAQVQQLTNQSVGAAGPGALNTSSDPLIGLVRLTDGDELANALTALQNLSSTLSVNKAISGVAGLKAKLVSFRSSADAQARTLEIQQNNDVEAARRALFP